MMGRDGMERHVSQRCPNMRKHSIYRVGVPTLAVPCGDCYSVESYWRRIPYEPDSRTVADGYPKEET